MSVAGKKVTKNRCSKVFNIVCRITFDGEWSGSKVNKKPCLYFIYTLKTIPLPTVEKKQTMSVKKAILEKWVVAQKKHHLSDKHVQMARELGLNPDKLGKIETTRRKHGKHRYRSLSKRFTANALNGKHPKRSSPWSKSWRSRKRRRKNRRKPKRNVENSMMKIYHEILFTRWTMSTIFNDKIVVYYIKWYILKLYI